MNLLSLVRLSPTYNDEKNGVFRDLFSLFRHFVTFPIQDHTGTQYTPDESYEIHCASLANLQRASIKNFKSKLTILALSNYGTIGKRPELESNLSLLNDAELAQLCETLGFRILYPPSSGVDVSRGLLLEILVSAHERRKTFQEVVQDLSVLPTEVFMSNIPCVLTWLTMI